MRGLWSAASGFRRGAFYARFQPLTSGWACQFATVLRSVRYPLILNEKALNMRINLPKHGVAGPLILGALVAALALWFRHGLLEAGVLPRDCTVVDAPFAACAFKDALVQTFLYQRLGWVSLAAGVLAFAFSCRRLAWAGWLCGVAGLVLYSYDPAAVGGLLALLVLVGADEQQRQGERESDQQPGDGLRVGGLG